ncbi:MAG: YifB family Mg chelatase-like AAA ATPase [Propioniciclava sp.]|uniref:YifB family Mg chelatase-like AAA ATPase n=1 Tax=Propioniciclava sp. TaxID=2038686 RepID=UPI0039E2C189
MRLGCARSVGLLGMEAALIDVEVSVGGGLPRTVIVGLPDTSLYEARDRCRAACASAGFGWPEHLVTINLSPASLPKAGTHFDLAIVAAVLAAQGKVPAEGLQDTVLVGEVGLDGGVRAVRGVLPAVLAAAREGVGQAIVPVAQVGEARLVDGVTVRGVGSLADLAAVLAGEEVPEPEQPARVATIERVPDLADVAGQLEARWALEVAAVGGHHLYLHGPPGVGKTLLAERLPGILPDLTAPQALEVAAIRSLCGLGSSGALPRRPPFAAPHHSASMPALTGGGPRVAQPGAISLAHRGVLFLDEAPEFSPRALEALRTPLESGVIELARSRAITRFPARFQLILAANPCPCGQSGTPGGACTCPPMAIRRYAARLSGPILDRVDIVQRLRPMTQSYLRAVGSVGEATAPVAARVREARERQARRLGEWGWTTNAEVPGRLLRTKLPLPDGVDLLDQAVARGQISARGVDKVLRLSWSIADLAGQAAPGGWIYRRRWPCAAVTRCRRCGDGRHRADGPDDPGVCDRTG